MIKDVAEAGRYSVVFGQDLDAARLTELRAQSNAEARRRIAPEAAQFRELEALDEAPRGTRATDRRAFVVRGVATQVWQGGLTRFAVHAASFAVNLPQCGGFKGTRIVSS
jgi:uncharacterized circularly permuted ATP-grasp superfamily protein